MGSKNSKCDISKLTFSNSILKLDKDGKPVLDKKGKFVI